MWAIFYLIIDHRLLFVFPPFPDCEKSASEMVEEQSLLVEIMKVVEKRDTLVSLLEEQRLKEKAEDRDLESMILSRGYQFHWTWTSHTARRAAAVTCKKTSLDCESLIWRSVSGSWTNACLIKPNWILPCVFLKRNKPKTKRVPFINWKWWMLDFTATEVRGLTANVLHTGAMIFLYLKPFFLFLFDSSSCFVETLNECLFRSSVNIPVAAKV